MNLIFNHFISKTFAICMLLPEVGALPVSGNKGWAPNLMMVGVELVLCALS